MTPAKQALDSTIDKMPKYKVLAADIEAMIATGALDMGAKAPSLRTVAARFGVSMSTAILAYRYLEKQGTLESKEKSGFYISTPLVSQLPVPKKSNPPVETFPVELSHSIIELLTLSNNPELTPFGCAIPGKEVLNTSKLNQHMSRAVRQNGMEFNLYAEPKGDYRLRLELSRHISGWGQHIAPENFIITNGCTEALYLALKVITRPGDIVVVESPVYFGVLQLFESLGLKALELPTHFHDGLDLQVFEDALHSHRPAAVVLSSSYSNPLGHTMSSETKQQVLNILETFNIPLVEDDVYGDLTFEDTRPKPYSAFKSRVDVYYCGSFTKTLSPGYRVGWVSSNQHIQLLLNNKLSTTLAGPALTQTAVASYLASGDYNRQLSRIRKIYQHSLNHMRQAVERYFPKGTSASQPKGGFVLWVVLPSKINTRKLLDKALKENICFVPGDMFTTTKQYQSALRLSAGYEWNNDMEKAIAKLGQLACS